MLKHLNKTIRASDCQRRTLVGQAERPLVILLYVDCHVTHTLVLSQVPHSQIPIVSTAEQLEALPSKLCSSDSVRMSSYLFNPLVLITRYLLVFGS